MPRTTLATLSALLAAPLAAPSPAQAAIPLPTGSFLQSCKIVSFDAATGHLQADCAGESVSIFDGTPSTPPFNVSGCKEGTIWNDNRQLYCYADTAWGNERVIPPGSYIATCTDRKVVGGALLTATCDNGDYKSVNASLDLRGCTWGGEIWNRGGRLGCDSAASAGSFSHQQQMASPFAKPKPVIHLAPVEPGIVKPALIAPVAPGEPEATGDEGNSKKKKRRRGERG